MHTRVVPGFKVIQPRFVVSFFAGKFLTRAVAGTVAQRRRSKTLTKEFFSKRQLEDAVTPTLAHPRELYLVFKDRRRHVRQRANPPLPFMKPRNLESFERFPIDLGMMRPLRVRHQRLLRDHFRTERTFASSQLLLRSASMSPSPAGPETPEHLPRSERI